MFMLYMLLGLGHGMTTPAEDGWGQGNQDSVIVGLDEDGWAKADQ